MIGFDARVTIDRGRADDDVPSLAIFGPTGQIVLMATVHGKRIEAWAPIYIQLGKAARSGAIPGIPDPELSPKIPNARKVIARLMGWSKP